MFGAAAVREQDGESVEPSEKSKLLFKACFDRAYKKCPKIRRGMVSARDIIKKQMSNFILGDEGTMDLDSLVREAGSRDSYSMKSMLTAMWIATHRTELASRRNQSAVLREEVDLQIEGACREHVYSIRDLIRRSTRASTNA
jgi:hypothetical protein